MDLLNALVALANFVIIPATAYGAQLALGALGVTLIYGILRFSNFAHGDTMAFGAMATILVTWMLQDMDIGIAPLPTALLALPFGIAICALLVIITDKTVYKFYRRQKAAPVILVIVSMGVMFILNGLVRFIIGPGEQRFADGERFIIRAREFREMTGLSEGLAFRTSQGITIVVAIVCVAALFWFLNRTRTGKSMRAYSDNEDLALLSGINPERVVLVTWLIVAALATIAGTLYLQQQYANVIVDAWLPVSHKIDAEVEIAGVVASVTYVSSLEYKTVELNPNLPRSYFTPTNRPTADTAESEQEAKEAPSEEAEKIKEILKQDELNDRDMARLTRLMEKEAENAREEEKSLEIEGTQFSVAEDAVRNDSAFWNEIRPVPLTPKELSTLAARDSVLLRRQVLRSTADSGRIASGRKLRMRDITNGRMYRSKNRKVRFRHDGLLDFSMLDFNTVDGWTYGQRFNIDIRPNRETTYRSEIRAAYNFARKSPDIVWNSSILYAPRIRGKVAFRMDYRSMDFNFLNGIPDLTNAVYSLFFRENYSARYEALHMQLEHRMDPLDGMVLFTTVEYNTRNALTNQSDFSFFFRDKDYRENVPIGYTGFEPFFNDSKVLFGQIRLEYTPEYYYRLIRGRKRYTESRFPTFYVNFRYTYPVETTGWADYRMIQAGLTQELEVGLLSKLNYRVEGGGFQEAENLHFSDFLHFKSSPLVADMMNFRETFFLLDIVPLSGQSDEALPDRIRYYRGSTNEYYMQSHLRFESPYILLKLLPWFSERLWNEAVSVSHLYTPDINNHFQLGYSLNEIGFLLDVGVFTAFENWKYHGTGVKINFRF